jgi:hypothetical protein
MLKLILMLLWVELCPSRRYWSLNPCYLWMWFYMEIRSLQIFKFRWVHYGRPSANMTVSW